MIYRRAVSACPDCGFYRLASFGKLLHHRNVEVAVDGHCQRAGDGGGRHHQKVWVISFHQHLVTLFHSKPVLFIDNRESQAMECYFFLKNSMGRSENLAAASGQVIQNISADCRFLSANKQPGIDIELREIILKGMLKLKGKDLVRC